MKIACVSISRSDWNALGMVAMALREQGAEVAAHVTTGHEAPEMLEADGFAPVHDTPHDADLIVLCGDRYVTALAALQAARSGVPLAHLAGGDITEGSTDDSYRHAITKLAHLHFPTHEDAAKRILQMGEEPWRVFNHGSASIDRVSATPLLSRAETMAAVGLPEAAANVIVLNWQPEGVNQHRGLIAALYALEEFHNDAFIVAVGANDDPGGQSVNDLLADLPRRNSRARFVRTLPARTYLSLLKHCRVLVGNSSSAFYEAPMFRPAVNIGDRQKGRARPTTDSVLDAKPNTDAIVAAIRQQWRGWDIGLGGIYGDSHAAPRIAETILSFAGQRDRLLRKKFAVAA